MSDETVKKITYEDKENLNNESLVPGKNKIDAADMNQIKEAVNNNADLFTALKELVDNGDLNGSSILYGTGIPDNELGKDGDVYINLSEDGEYARYLFTKESNEWLPQFSIQGGSVSAVADTLPIGSQVMWDGDTPIPTGWSETEAPFYRPNLVVNGDFHCWQRGEEFTFPCNEIQERGYTADMWYMYCNHYDISDTHNITIKKINGNFVIINNLDSPFHFSMAQKHKISKSDLRDGKITISFKMKAAVEQDLNFALEFLSGPTDSLSIGKEYTVTNEWKTYTFDFDVMDYIDNMIQLNIWINTSDITVAGNQTIEIEYCRWDHGDIDFPHIPEDEAIASYRCKRYIQWLKIPQRKTYYSTSFHSGENFEVEMIDTPTVIYSDVRNENSGVVAGTVFENITKRGIGVLLVNKEIISAEILVSCEP